MGRWSDLSSSRWIAKADVQDGVNTGALILSGSAPGIGNEQFISRAEIEAWVTCTGSGSTNQWQVKSGLTYSPASSHTIYWPGEVNISTSPSIACSLTVIAYTVYSDCSTLNNGCKVWNQFGLWTTEPTYMSEWYKTSDNRTFQTNSSGIIYNMQACVACLEYYNPQSYDLYVTGNNCSGVAFGTWVGPGQSICLQDGSGGGDFGFMVLLGNC